MLASERGHSILVPKRFSDQVYDGLKQAIISLDYPPDCVLLEDEVARRFGVSKTPVRAAMSQLEREGFLVITPHKETRVAGLSLDDLWQMYQTKNALEGYCVCRLAGNLTPAQVEAILATLSTANQAIASGDGMALMKANDRLHSSFVEFFGNRRFVAIISNLRDHLQRGRALLMSHGDPVEVNTMHRYHSEIAEAIIAGDGRKAEDLLHEHNEVFFAMLRGAQLN